MRNVELLGAAVYFAFVSCDSWGICTLERHTEVSVIESSRQKPSEHLPHCGIFAMVSIRNHQNCWPPQSLDLKLLDIAADTVVHHGFRMTLVASAARLSAFFSFSLQVLLLHPVAAAATTCATVRPLPGLGPLHPHT